MKYILIFVLAINLFGNEIDDIIKNIPKSSQNYTLDIAIANKTRELKYYPIQISDNIKTQTQFLKSYKKIISYEKLSITLPTKIKTIQDKLDILSDTKNNSDKLQKLYYKKLLKISIKQSKNIDDNLQDIEKDFFDNLQNIDFHTTKIDKELLYWQNKIVKKQKELGRLNITLQKWQLLNNNDKINNITNLIVKNKLQQKEIYRSLLDNQLLIWFKLLQDKDKKVFIVDDNIIKYATRLDISKSMKQVVNDFEKYIFGNKALVYGAKKEVEFTFSKIIDFINYPLFTVSNRVITPLNFAFFILVLLVGWLIAKYYKYFINKLRHANNISHSTATLLANMGYYIIVTLSFLMALKVVGLDLSSLAIIAGALSVGIGFGLQNIVSNFVSGIILMFERSIKVGDYIQIDDDTRGEVLDISMRSTIVRTNDNINLIIPNQSFIQNNVINWTLGDDIVRFRVPFGVAYGSDIDEVESVILLALEESKLPYIKTAKNFEVPPPTVVFIEMGDSSLNFEFFIWVKGEYARKPRRTRSRFLKMIYQALNKAGITIPFPQTDLHIVDSVPFEINIKK